MVPVISLNPSESVLTNSALFEISSAENFNFSGERGFKAFFDVLLDLPPSVDCDRFELLLYAKIFPLFSERVLVVVFTGSPFFLGLFWSEILLDLGPKWLTTGLVQIKSTCLSIF